MAILAPVGRHLPPNPATPFGDMGETALRIPAGFTLGGAVAWSGISRSGLYRAAACRKLLMRKCGRTTIVDGPSLAALVASLPQAEIRAPRSAT